MKTVGYLQFTRDRRSAENLNSENREQIQLVVRAGLGAGTVGIRVQRHDRPLTKKIIGTTTPNKATSTAVFVVQSLRK